MISNVSILFQKAATVVTALSGGWRPKLPFVLRSQYDETQEKLHQTREVLRETRNVLRETHKAQYSLAKTVQHIHNELALEKESHDKTKLALASALDEAAFDPMLDRMYNRRGALIVLKAEASQNITDTQKRQMGVIAIDFDRFSRVNDLYGHDIGDIVLKHCADIISNAVRSEDIVVRMGGEEINVLMPKSKMGVIRKIASRIRQRLEKTTIYLDRASIESALPILKAKKQAIIDGDKPGGVPVLGKDNQPLSPALKAELINKVDELEAFLKSPSATDYPLKQTASLGICQYSLPVMPLIEGRQPRLDEKKLEADWNSNAIVKPADSALLAAKDRGRNCIVLYDGQKYSLLLKQQEIKDVGLRTEAPCLLCPKRRQESLNWHRFSSLGHRYTRG